MDAQVPQKVRPITIAVLAMGGEGGGVLAEWIVDLAEHAGYLAQMTSVPGVAQRTGATIYYLELFPYTAVNGAGREPVLALMPTPGDVDIVIASELMEAGRAIQRGLVTPDRTTLIASTSRTFSMTERLALADGRVDDAKLIEACRSAARQLHAFDMAALAEATGSVISAVLFGALAGAHVLPFPRTAFEMAIRRGGVGVAASLAAFTAGFEAVSSGVLPKFGVTEEPARTRPLPPEVAALISEAERIFPQQAQATLRAGILRAADYQTAAYARLYLDRLLPLVEVERRQRDPTCRLLQETARQLALGMAYEDTIRVAELKIRPSRFARVRDEVKLAEGQVLEIAEFMHPRTQEIADTLPASLGRFILRTGWMRRLIDSLTKSGRTVKTTSLHGFLLLYMVAAFKPLRPRSLRYQNEQSALEEWLATVLRVAETDYDLAVEIAACRNLVKGYGDTHERGRACFDEIMAVLPDLSGRPNAAVRLTGLHRAASADDTGAGLKAAIAALQSELAEAGPGR